MQAGPQGILSRSPGPQYRRPQCRPGRGSPPQGCWTPQLKPPNVGADIARPPPRRKFIQPCAGQ
eukprot:3366345-Alexandrium_andersonii.AAC.1